jgi:hypothetical protein
MDTIFGSTMSHCPPSLQEKVVQAVATWFAMAIVSIPLWDAVTVLPFCWSTPPGPADIHICLPVLAIFQMFENWLGVKRDIGSLALHYWPVVPIASAFTALLLHSWWRDQSRAT